MKAANRFAIGRIGMVAVLMVLAAAFAHIAPGAFADGHVREIAAFDEGEFPEGLSVAADGTVLVGILSTGEVRKITPGGTVSTIGSVSLGEGDLLIGIKAIDSSSAYALVNSSGSSNGVWRVGQSGSAHIAELPTGTLLNAITMDGTGRLLVTDSIGGQIFAVSLDGSFETWIHAPELLGNVAEPGPLGFPIGVNGIVVTPEGDAVYVAVSEQAQVVRIEINSDGSAGAVSVVAADPALGGADGVDLASDGTLYVGVNGQNQIAAVDTANGDVSIVASGPIFRFPAVVRLSPDEGTLYVSNFDGLVLFGLSEGPAQTGVLAIDLASLGGGTITPPNTGDAGLATQGAESRAWLTALGVMILSAGLFTGLRVVRATS